MERNKINIHDKFLPQKDFDLLKNELVVNNSFPWFLNYNKVYGDGVVQFTHTFYYDFIPNSQYYDYLLPVFKILMPNAIKRIKANLTLKSDEIKPYGMHQDFDDKLSLDQMKTGILYLNTNNGKTFFKDEKEIESIENRMVIFPTSMMHSGSTHTDQPVRVVINFNWF